MSQEPLQPEVPTADGSVWDAARRQVGATGCLSIIMPAYCLGTAIARNVREVHALFRDRLPFEIIAVDDGSSDNTAAELARVSSELDRVVSVPMSENMGKGEALRRGFEASRGTHILLLDGDLELPPDQVSQFFVTMEVLRADAVIGSKRHPDSVLEYPWYRKLASTLYYLLVKMLIGLPVRDTQTGLKLFRREVLEHVIPRMLVKRFAFDLELLAIANLKGFRIAEAPVTLHFKATLGCFRPRTVKFIMTDTLAIVYRLRVLRYYQTIRDTRMPSPQPLVSILIPTRAIEPEIQRCLAAIRRQTYRRCEVVILPDRPSGREWPEGVREVPTGLASRAGKRERAIAEARGELLVLLDSRSQPSDNWMRQAVVYFSDPAIAAVGGPCIPPGGSMRENLAAQVLASRLVSGHLRCRHTPTRVATVPKYPSQNLFVRSEVLRQRPAFGSALPSEELVFRNSNGGGPNLIIYDPRVLVYRPYPPLFLSHVLRAWRHARERGARMRHGGLDPCVRPVLGAAAVTVAIVAGGGLTLAIPALLPAWQWTVGLYSAVTFLSCFRVQPSAWLILWVAMVLTHLTHGIGFLAGLCGPERSNGNG